MKAKEMQIGVTYMANAGYGREISNYYDEKQLRERYSWTLIKFRDKYTGAKFAEMRNTFDDRVREIPLSKIVGKFEDELIKYLEDKETFFLKDKGESRQHVHNEVFDHELAH